MVDIENPKNYKKCVKKQYDIYVCMPPEGTIVVNKLEQAEVVHWLHGKTYITVEEFNKLSYSVKEQLNTLIKTGRAYRVSGTAPFVLCGTVGELRTIKSDELSSSYTFLQGGKPLTINGQSVGSRQKDGMLDWTLVRASQQVTVSQNMACFVPLYQTGLIQTSRGRVLKYNDGIMSHGKGDFIVCSVLPNGQPNLKDRWVVNGEIFQTTYNNRGWSDCLSKSPITGYKMFVRQNRHI